MEQMTELDAWVDRLDDMSVEVVDQVVRETALLGRPPTVHVLVDGLGPPYVGYLTCRQFLRGRDAHGAVAVMGLLGSMLGASRLVITYENADLAAALRDPGADEAPTAVVVIDADRAGRHTVRWHPVLLTEGPATSGIVPRWSPTRQYRDGGLPPPVAQLLAVWREPRAWPEPEFLKVYTGWELGGYTMRWVKRPVGERGRPAWMELLAPVM